MCIHGQAFPFLRDAICAGKLKWCFMHLAQIAHPSDGRRVALVEGDRLLLLATHPTAYDAVQAALSGNVPLRDVVARDRSTTSIDYDSVYNAESPWRLLPPFDYPGEPARCLVSGTGLTHKASAENRAAMHRQPASSITDSMRMYEWGIEGGRPAPGEIGAQPEWFYKGSGSILRAHGEPLEIPAFADDGGEEPEIAGIYVIDSAGTPRRIGLALANEFSDHVMEKRNYLYLAPSKLRACSLGPELALDAGFDHLEGTVTVQRNGRALWSKTIYSGERNMSHSLANLEHHHFKYPGHRRPGDVHVHFFGADAFSFGDGIALEEGDTMQVYYPGFGRALRNRLVIDRSPQHLVRVEPI
jgi:hypothetical protein